MKWSAAYSSPKDISDQMKTGFKSEIAFAGYQSGAISEKRIALDFEVREGSGLLN